MGGRASVIMVLGFAAIFAMIQYRLSEVGTEATDNMISYHDQIAIHDIAVAGANLGLSKVYQDTLLSGLLSDPDPTPYRGGSFSVRIDSVDVDLFLLKSIGTYRDKQDFVEVYLSGITEQSFSIFAYMTNSEKWQGSNVYFVTGDSVFGRLHTNDNIKVYGSPVFMEKVTTAKTFDPPPGSGNNQGVYKDGFETGVAPIDFPTDLSGISSAAQAGGYYTTDEVWLILDPGSAANNDGKIYVFTDQVVYQEAVSEGEMEGHVDVIDINDPLFNGVFASWNKVHVQGTLDGKLTIASTDDHMWLDDDVVYERPVVVGDPTSTDDLLGLVAQDNIYITDNSVNHSDINIHATIFSRQGSFTSENYDTRPVSGTINLMGGIVQDTRGPVGTGFFSGGQVVINTGFYKRYYYDDRLSDNLFRPPSFPGFWSKTLRVASWWE